MCCLEREKNAPTLFYPPSRIPKTKKIELYPSLEWYCDGSQLSLLQPTLLNNLRTVSELYRDGAHSYIPGKNYIRVHYLEL